MVTNDELNTEVSMNEQRKLIEHYKTKLIESKSEEEIQRMADNAIISIRKEIKSKRMPADLSPLFQNVIDLFRRDPVRGLALLDHMADFLSDEIKKMGK